MLRLAYAYTAANRYNSGLQTIAHATVFQRIGYEFPKLAIQVRFLSVAPHSSFSNASHCCGIFLLLNIVPFHFFAIKHADASDSAAYRLRAMFGNLFKRIKLFAKSSDKYYMAQSAEI
jgi:hypothetical protein